MPTTAKTLLDIAALLQETYSGVATGGSTTSLVDANCPSPNGWFKGGTLFFLSGANAGKTAVISDYVSSSHTFSFAAMTAAVVAGVRYTALRAIYTRQNMIQALNITLEEMGKVLQIDSTLVGASGQTVFTLPDGVRDLRRVQVGTEREKNYHWQEVNGQLIFDSNEEPGSGEVIYVWYRGTHITVNDDADLVSDYIDSARLNWTAAYHLALQRLQRVENSDPYVKEFLGVATIRMQELSIKRPHLCIPRDPRISGY